MKVCILLTGSPGVGKTTIIERVTKRLSQEHASSAVRFSGFYTKESRSAGKRVGFDVVTVPEGKTATLARTSLQSAHKVGAYGVDVKSFESAVLPLLRQHAESKCLYVIDEVGKMESFSSRFMEAARKLLSWAAEHKEGQQAFVIGTVALRTNLRSINSIKELDCVEVWHVTQENRDALASQLYERVSSYLTG